MKRKSSLGLNINHAAFEAAQTISYPFHCQIIKNFLNIDVSSLRKHILNENFYQKSNDLYDFYQSNDLSSSKNEEIKSFCSEIYSEEFRLLMSKATGLVLSDTVDLSAHRYPPNGHLLCHDDDVGSLNDARKIAFILYLVEDDWNISDGGQLQLFDSDDNGDPSTIIHSILPCNYI
jgi:Rps23 Pro-64 3,4-dihydroxylase Tpa1-like proline 4-hydroxylase